MKGKLSSKSIDSTTLTLSWQKQMEAQTQMAIQIL